MNFQNIKEVLARSDNYRRFTKPETIERRELLCELLKENPELSRKELCDKIAEKTGKKAPGVSTIARDKDLFRTVENFLTGKLTAKKIRAEKRPFWKEVYRIGVCHLVADEKGRNFFKKEKKCSRIRALELALDESLAEIKDLEKRVETIEWVFLKNLKEKELLKRETDNLKRVISKLIKHHGGKPDEFFKKK